MAFLFALVGTALFIAARRNPDRTVDRGIWASPPTWVRTFAGGGSGPISIMNLSFEIYGAGMAILGLAAGLVRPDPAIAEFLLATWVLGGVFLLTVAEVVLALLARRRADPTRR